MRTFRWTDAPQEFRKPWGRRRPHWLAIDVEPSTLPWDRVETVLLEDGTTVSIGYQPKPRKPKKKRRTQEKPL